LGAFKSLSLKLECESRDAREQFGSRGLHKL
jgi:hypothetical protein